LTSGAFMEVEGLEVAYGGRLALRGASLRVGEGESVAVVGANGAGKSTMARALAGLISPERGRVTINGRDTAGRKPDQIVREGLALVPEGRGLFVNLTVRENLLLGAYTRGRHVQDSDVFAQFESYFPEILSHLDVRAGMLSGGQQQMVAIARALMSSPRLLMLDEPTMGLAPRIVSRLATIIAELREDRGMSVLLFDQRRTLPQLIGCRGYILRSGEIRAEVPAGGWEHDSLAEHYLASRDK
jgi:branched-chain amino acid transport system ATP-binding protein